jgi:hypothetical protein
MFTVKYFFVGLLFFGLFLLVIAYILWRKRSLAFRFATLAVILYGVICTLLFFYVIEIKKPHWLPKHKLVKKPNPLKAIRGCDCTWESLHLSKDDYTTFHKPAAQKITQNRYLRTEVQRANWIRHGQLVPVAELEGFGISYLNFSTAHLTPLARKRLYELGIRFRNNITEVKQKKSYFVISSLTRSHRQQERIKKRYSRAATKDHSTHCYGVAFDIYRMVSPNGQCTAAVEALEKTLTQMQQEGKLFLCPEAKCIHVTVCH